MQFHIRQLRVRAYRGIEALDTRAVFPGGIPDRGMLIRGDNGEGKTSVLNAIRAALAAQDIGPDAIRHGEERAEILINTDDATVQRVITAKGSRLQVNDGSVRAPADWLATMLGTAAFDPFDLLEKDAKKRRATVLGALPVRVTREQLDKWLDGWTLETTPDLSLHGLEVVELVRKDFYERRRAENAAVKDWKKEIAALEAGAPPAVPNALSVADAKAKHLAASTAYGELISRKKRVAEHHARTKRARELMSSLRDEAAGIRAIPPPSPSIGEQIVKDSQAASDAYNQAAEVVSSLEDEMRRLQARLDTYRTDLSARAADVELVERRALDHKQSLATHDERLRKADVLDTQARELEEAVSAASERAPTDEEIAAALAENNAAIDEGSKAAAAELREEHEAKVREMQERLARATESAGKLDAMVQKFTKDVPAALLAATDGVQGLTIEGDAIFLDGVDLDKLSGREQLLFAVEIARRLNSRAKILIVDGLERVTQSHLQEFLEKATAGGYQLIATRSEPGGVVFDAIEITEEP